MLCRPYTGTCSESKCFENLHQPSQLLALKWIRENIESFGGDRDNVTLAGQSAGAVSAHFMMLSDHAKGLFHKAILQGGSMAFDPKMTPKDKY